MTTPTQEDYKELKDKVDSESGGPFGFLGADDNVLRLVQDPRREGVEGFYAQTYSLFAQPGGEVKKTKRFVVFALVAKLGDKEGPGKDIVMPVIVPKKMLDAMLTNLAAGADILSPDHGRTININKSGTGLATQYNLITLKDKPVVLADLTWPEETLDKFAEMFALRSEEYVANKVAETTQKGKAKEEESLAEDF